MPSFTFSYYVFSVGIDEDDHVRDIECRFTQPKGWHENLPVIGHFLPGDGIDGIPRIATDMTMRCNTKSVNFAHW